MPRRDGSAACSAPGIVLAAILAGVAIRVSAQTGCSSTTDSVDLTANAEAVDSLQETLRQYELVKGAIANLDAKVLAGTTSMLAPASSPAPLRLHLSFATWQLEMSGSEGKKKADLIKNVIMPRVAGEVAKRLRVKAPPSGKLKLLHPCDSSIVREVLEESGQVTPGSIELTQTLCFSFLASADYCGSPALGIMHIPQAFHEFKICDDNGFCQLVYGEGVDANFVLYVGIKPNGCTNNQRVAFSQPCYLSTANGRPLAGFVNFCEEYIKEDNIDSLVEVGIHEVLHSLFFNDALFELYIGEDDNPVGRKKIVKETPEGTLEVVSKNAVAQAREHFGCGSISGVPLEDQGGCGTESSHWDARVLEGELMTGEATGSAAYSRHVWSSVTLGLAQDSGWYLPVYGESQILQFGLGEGCEFLSETCWALANNAESSFCKGSAAGCTSDRLATAQCMTVPFANDCRSFLPAGVSSDCLDASSAPAYSFLNNGGFSRCMEAESQEGDTSDINPASVCIKMMCEDGSLHLVIGEKVTACPPGGYLEIAESQGSSTASVLKIGPCPEPEEICPSLSCPEDCSTNGRCLGGKCQCFLGYTGSNCSKTVCYSGSCALDEMCNLQSGECEVISNNPPSPGQLGLPIPGFDLWPEDKQQALLDALQDAGSDPDAVLELEQVAVAAASTDKSAGSAGGDTTSAAKSLVALTMPAVLVMLVTVLQVLR